MAAPYAKREPSTLTPMVTLRRRSAIPLMLRTAAIVNEQSKEATMFSNVLVGVDGTRNGRDAIALAAHLVDSDGRLTLAHVHSGEMVPPRVIAPDPTAEDGKTSTELLERERAAAGVKADLVGVMAPNPGRGLHQRAEEQRADLLVVGSCARGGLGRVMLGDDTRASLNGASCAVAVASRGYAEHPAPIARIGVGYDGSPESKAALAVAAKLAASTGASVQALEIVSIPTYAYTGLMPTVIDGSAEAMLSEANRRMAELKDVEGRAVYGLPGEELATFGDQLDILLVGSRSYGPLRRLVLGSTSDYLERHARCSLLVLPRAAEGLATGDEPHAEATTGAPGTG
jgi:nucleotide-binding universal stress UspA family protein